MASISIDLDEQTLERAKALASSQQQSVGELLQNVIERFIGAEPRHPSWGIMRDEPELMDQIVEEAHRHRKERKFRSPPFDE
jgi:hypothetical protein